MLTRNDHPDSPAVADAYESMSAFWRSMEQHARGLERGTIWDTFECGERRTLERTIANIYQAPDAVVVSSGMCAISVAVMAIARTFGLKVQRNIGYGYFESTDVIDNVFRPLGVTQDSAGGGIALMEPVVNAPTLRAHASWALEAKFVLIDNSLFSVSMNWPLWRQHLKGSFCLIESLPKYWTHAASGGVVVGDSDAIEVVRTTARQLGVLLSRQACVSILKERYVETVTERLHTMAANTQVFASVLRDTRPELVVRLPHEIAWGFGLDKALSSLAFVLYPLDLPMEEEFERWAVSAAGLTGHPMIRAGYGWDETYGRAYGHNILNTAAGCAYLRFSVGVEAKDTIAQIARALGRVTR